MKIDELSEKQVNLLLDLENQRKKNATDGGKYSDFYLRAYVLQPLQNILILKAAGLSGSRG